MPRLRNMLGETGTVEIDVPGDEPLVVTYRRGALTPRLQAKALEIQRLDPEQVTPETVLGICEIYAQIVASWNLTDEEGRTIETTAEALADVDFSILNLVLRAIGREQAPDPTSAAGSSNGSSAAASSELHLSTTGS
jgi:hypothetical protein